MKDQSLTTANTERLESMSYCEMADTGLLTIEYLESLNRASLKMSGDEQQQRPLPRLQSENSLSVMDDQKLCIHHK